MGIENGVRMGIGGIEEGNRWESVRVRMGIGGNRGESRESEEKGMGIGPCTDGNRWESMGIDNTSNRVRMGIGGGNRPCTHGNRGIVVI